MSRDTARRCASCRQRTHEYDTWQPFGPDTSVATCTTPGSHYRGFPALALCWSCRNALDRGEQISFAYRGEHYIADAGQNRVWPSPF